ncbi:MAG: BACON domain-containing protein [Alistipes sp.]|nr:BACON domain-containing protein [Alistipes sp.]
MKRLFSILFALGAIGAAGSLASCEELMEQFNDLATMQIPDVELSHKATDSHSISFTAPAAWSVEIAASGEWLSVDPSSGEAGRTTITLEAVSANESPEPRTARVIISSVGIERSFNVTQAGAPENEDEGDDEKDPDDDGDDEKDPDGEEDETELLMNIDGLMEYITFATSGGLIHAGAVTVFDEATRVTVRSDVEWLKPVIINAAGLVHRVDISCDPNPGELRGGAITIVAENGTQQQVAFVKVTQVDSNGNGGDDGDGTGDDPNPGDYYLMPATEVKLYRDGGETGLFVETNLPNVEPYNKDMPEWLTVTETGEKVEGGFMFVVAADRNNTGADRSFNLLFHGFVDGNEIIGKTLFIQHTIDVPMR